MELLQDIIDNNLIIENKNWNEKHSDKLSFGDLIADGLIRI